MAKVIYAAITDATLHRGASDGRTALPLQENAAPTRYRYRRSTARAIEITRHLDLSSGQRAHNIPKAIHHCSALGHVVFRIH